MKQLLIIAIALSSVNAFATRARMTALGNSAHLVDTQTVYSRPTHIFELGGDYVTLESGKTTTGLADGSGKNAEGMIARTMGNAKMGLSLGHQSSNASSWGLRGTAALFGGSYGNLAVNQQNPIEFTYGVKDGDFSWAGTLVYSSYNNKAATGTTLEKENSLGFRVGAASGPWDVTLASGMTNTANLKDGSKYTGTLALSLIGGYKMESMYFFGEYVAAGAKVEDTAGSEVGKVSSTTMKLGVVNSQKKDANELFYSVALNQDELKRDTSVTSGKDTSLSLPITIGVEVDAASWLTLRGSVTQSTLIYNIKKEVTGTSEVAPGANSTTVAAGAGLKFNKLTLDGTLSQLTGSTATQTLNGNDLLAQVGMTYVF